MVSAFSQPPGFIKAVIPMYPLLKRNKPILKIPPIPKSVLQGHLKSMQCGKIVTESTPPKRMDIALSIAQRESILKYYGTDNRHDLWKLLEEADDMPYTLIIHGGEDSAVPVGDNIEWVVAATKKFEAGKIKLHIEPGAEHGFDCGVPLDTPWLQENLKPITAVWLGWGGLAR